MAGGSNQKIPETPQQRALTEFAVKQLDDYRQRWLPVQQGLAEQVTAMGGKDSTERRAAAGRTGADTAVKFAGAQGALETALANKGTLGSSKGKLAITGLGSDAAKSKGLGLTIADQRIDEAYTHALGALAQTGRGERAQVTQSMTQQAAMSGRQASADAEAALVERMGTAGIVGRGVGLAAQRLMKPPLPDDGTGSVPGGYWDASGGRVNNPSAFTSVLGTGLSGMPRTPQAGDLGF